MDAQRISVVKLPLGVDLRLGPLSSNVRIDTFFRIGMFHFLRTIGTAPFYTMMLAPRQEFIRPYLNPRNRKPNLILRY